MKKITIPPFVTSRGGGGNSTKKTTKQCWNTKKHHQTLQTVFFSRKGWCFFQPWPKGVNGLKPKKKLGKDGMKTVFFSFFRCKVCKTAWFHLSSLLKFPPVCVTLIVCVQCERGSGLPTSAPYRPLPCALHSRGCSTLCCTFGMCRLARCFARAEQAFPALTSGKRIWWKSKGEV